ncbi:hypothetical protein Sbal117_1959 [Shewanella baltica OS117]|nr:hypothetical protein Sbal117_1959 [Shewanella baltica OS117]
MKRIAIVEDEAAIRENYKDVLQSGSRRYLASSPHTTLHAAPHRAVHLERLT